MDGFKRPAKPQQRPPALPPVAVPSVTDPANGAKGDGVAVTAGSSSDVPVPEAPSPGRGRRRFVVVGTALILIVLASLAFWWYRSQLLPADSADTSVQRVEIKEGSSFGYVAGRLEERGVIRSALAFRLFAILHGKQDDMKAGTCNLTPTISAREVLDKITTGCHDFKSITFYPGATLETSLYAKTRAAQKGEDFKDMSIRASLRAAGYEDAEISEAFTATYESRLFAGKPANEGLEGYVFGETYHVDMDATVKEVLRAAFDHMLEIVEAEHLESKFKAQGLTLYKGITLASIVGRELDCEGKPAGERRTTCYGYQQQIAAVFYNRLADGMSLGSDVTSIYASDRLGVASSVNADSPYNTRKYAGLTPGPIATPGELALLATADPADSDDLYFLAGDDGLIYFAKDEAGHRANITNHCKVSCGNL